MNKILGIIQAEYKLSGIVEGYYEILGIVQAEYKFNRYRQMLL